MIDFAEVEDALDECKGIAWDTCHKIYILMDDEQVAQMREYEYDPIITSDEKTPAEMFEIVKGWFDESCFLRFVDAVSTNKENPNAGFRTLIPQGAGNDEGE